MRSSLFISIVVLSASCVTNAQRPRVFVEFDPATESPALPDLEFSPSEVELIEAILPKVDPDLENDILGYAANIITEPKFLSAAAALASAIPSSVQDQIENHPSDFVVSLITATQPPPWVTAIPSDVQSYLLSVGQHFASIVDEDVDIPEPTPLRGSFVFPTAGFVIPNGLSPQGTAGFPRPTGTGTGTGVLPSGTGRLSGTGTGFVTGVFPTATGTGASTGVIPIPTAGVNGTSPPLGQATPSPIDNFEGAASSPLNRRTGSVGAAAAFIGAACWLLI